MFSHRAAALLEQIKFHFFPTPCSDAFFPFLSSLVFLLLENILHFVKKNKKALTQKPQIIKTANRTGRVVFFPPLLSCPRGHKTHFSGTQESGSKQ